MIRISCSAERFFFHTFYKRFSTSAKRMSAGQFREFISKDHAVFKPEAGRYILYSAYVCPFVQRALIARAIKKLENIVPVIHTHSVNDPENGWRFDPSIGVDPVLGAKYMKEIYKLSDPNYDDRITVPVLFDTKTRKIVNNESADIVRIFNTGFNDLLGPKTVNLLPKNLENEIETNLKPWLLSDLTFTLYKVVFAKTQSDYEERSRTVFRALDRIEGLLKDRPWLAGDVLTEADVNIFPWILRLPSCYEPLGRLNLKSLRSDDDYPNIRRWMRKIYQLPGVAATFDADQCIEGSFRSFTKLFPDGNALVPLYRGPDLTKPAEKVDDKDFAWF